jgi:N-methylhydantoinase B
VPIPQELPRSPDVPPSHATYVPLSSGDTFQAFCAGGCGLGDPLFREPWRVARDVEDELVTADVAQRVYGVVLNAAGGADEDATAAKRKEIRAERLGGEPEREPDPMLEYRSPLRLEGEAHAQAFACNHCGRQLAPTTGSWRAGAATRAWPLAERSRDLGIWVRPRTDPAMWLSEFCCPSCGSLLEVNIYEEGETPGRDIRLGETSDEPGEPF